MDVIIPLHIDSTLTDKCAEILNEEWPRSLTARQHSLSKSCDSLPVCLALVRNEANATEVVGFSKVASVQGIEKAGLVESVIVQIKDRGRGLGRVLMDLTEQYVKRHCGVETMYLSTLDKQGFYSHLGYIQCQPVVSLGANAHRVPQTMLNKFLSSPQPLSKKDETLSELNNTTVLATAHQDILQDSTNTPASRSTTVSAEPPASCVPPPPPVPPPSAPPPPPPVPPPPPHSKCQTSSVASGAVSQTHSRMITRMDPNSTTWMKKTL